jgi:hypothetical protein
MSLLPNLDQMTDNEKLAVLESIQKSIAQSKEIQKKKIGENVDLVVQALKKIEYDITTRFESVGNSIEKRVLSIKDGRDGSNGKDGRDGKDGKNGKDGLKGDRGLDGQAGRDGVDGVDGISVVNANIDFDGSLVITLSDGREINVGEVVSADVAEKIKVISTMSTNAAIAVKEEGTTLTSGVKSLNFVGTGITATTSGDDVTVTVASGSGTVTSVAATAGTGISVSGSPITTSGTLTITNTAPDQTVVLTAGTGINTSGTYPNFTITNSAPDQTVALTGAGTTSITGTYPNFTITSNDAFTGTVTSVTGTSPVASSGGATPAISLATGYGDTQNPYASKTANFVLAAPNGSAGAPTFRAIVAADIPTLNQNTTGTASNVTGTVAVANGGTGATSAATALTNLGAVAKAGDTMTGALGFIAGSASTPSLFASGDTNTGIYFPAADTIAFAEGGVEAMRIDSDGDVGIGTTTPNSKLTSQTASTSTSVFSFANQLNNSYASNDSISALGFHNRADVNATGVGGAIAFSGGGTSDGSGNLIFCIKPTGNIATVVAPSNEKMRIDSSGNVGIGTASPASKLDINTGGSTGTTDMITLSGLDSGSAKQTYGVIRMGIENSTAGSEQGNLHLQTVESGTVRDRIFMKGGGEIAFSNGGSERMRIDSSGNLLLNRTSLIGTERFSMEVDGSKQAQIIRSTNTSGNPQIFRIATGQASGGIGTGRFITCDDGGSDKFFVAGSGVVNSTSTSITSISDFRLKENVRVLDTGLDSVMALKPRRFDWKEGQGTNKKDVAGFIAQEVETVLPDLIGEWKNNESDETIYKSLSMGDMLPTLVKAIQEQQALIQSLTIRITALEAK